MSARDVTRFVQSLLRGRRPRPRRSFQASEEEARVLRTAIELRAARPGAGAAREEFVTGLHRRLSTELSRTDPGTVSSGRGRRQVIALAGVAAATAVVAAAVEHTVDDDHAQEQAEPTLTPQTGSWQLVAATTDLPDGAVSSFDLGEVTGFVQRAGGRLSAVSGICTHQGCRLRLDAAQHRLRCPCHSTSFALTGELVSHALAVPPSPLPQLAVRETGGDIEVYAPAPDPAEPSPTSDRGTRPR